MILFLDTNIVTYSANIEKLKRYLKEKSLNVVDVDANVSDYLENMQVPSTEIDFLDTLTYIANELASGKYYNIYITNKTPIGYIRRLINENKILKCLNYRDFIRHLDTLIVKDINEKGYGYLISSKTPIYYKGVDSVLLNILKKDIGHFPYLTLVDYEQYFHREPVERYNKPNNPLMDFFSGTAPLDRHYFEELSVIYGKSFAKLLSKSALVLSNPFSPFFKLRKSINNSFICSNFSKGCIHNSSTYYFKPFTSSLGNYKRPFDFGSYSPYSENVLDFIYSCITSETDISKYRYMFRLSNTCIER